MLVLTEDEVQISDEYTFLNDELNDSQMPLIMPARFLKLLENSIAKQRTFPYEKCLYVR